jgi:uncharacterized protein (UPF0333 family)
MILYILLFIFFVLATVFSVLYFIKENKCGNPSNDLKSLFHELDSNSKVKASDEAFDCIVKKISDVNNGDTNKISAVIGKICAEPSDQKYPQVCKDYNIDKFVDNGPKWSKDCGFP